MYIKLTELVSLHKVQKQSTSLNDRQTEIDCTGGDLVKAAEWGKPNCQPCNLTTIQLQKVEHNGIKTDNYERQKS